MEGRAVQPAPRLRQLRPQLRAAQPAPLLVQQPARLVPDVRGAGRPAGGERRPADPRPDAVAPRRARSPRGRRCDGRTAFLPFAEALARHGGFSLDTPFDELDPEHQRAILHGTGDDVDRPVAAREPRGSAHGYAGRSPSSSTRASSPRSTRRRAVSFVYRQRLDHLVDEVPCSDLPRLAAAGRRRGRRGSPALTLGELCGQPLGETLAALQGPEARRSRQQQVAGELLREIANRLQVPGRCRPRLPHARPPGADALRRRGAAHPPGQPDRQRPDRRALRPRRADHRPAPARQRAGCCAALQRLRDLGNTLVAGRARPRGDRAPPTTCSTSAPAPATAAARSPPRGTPKQVLKAKDVADRPVPRRARRRSRCRRTAASTDGREPRRRCRSARRLHDRQGARQHNLKNVDVALPARGVRRRHRRQRLGQELARQRGALQHARPQAAPGPDRRGRPRRDPRPRAHRQDHQRRSGPDRQLAVVEPGDVHRRLRPDPRSCSPSCPRRRSAATTRGGSASTSRAAAARRARATARRRSRCTSCPTSGSSATSATAAATTPRRWPSGTRASRSPTC